MQDFNSPNHIFDGISSEQFSILFFQVSNGYIVLAFHVCTGEKRGSRRDLSFEGKREGEFDKVFHSPIERASGQREYHLP